jgi:hypothetical protein
MVGKPRCPGLRVDLRSVGLLERSREPGLPPTTRSQQTAVHVGPPRPLVAVSMQRLVVGAAQGHGELVADLAAETSVIAAKYVSRLLGSRKIERYLEDNHPEIAKEFRAIVSATVPDSGQETASPTKASASEDSLERCCPRRGRAQAHGRRQSRSNNGVFRTCCW